MAAVTATSVRGDGVKTVVTTTLGSSDTLTYRPSFNPILILTNETGGALTPKIDGADGSTVPVAGVGNIDVSAGYTFASIANGGTVAINLSSIAAFLKGVITITGGSGIKAKLLEF